MRALRLDFQRRPPTRPLGWILLGAGTAILAGLALSHQLALRDAAAHRATVQRIEQTLPSASRLHMDARASDAALGAARKALDQLSLPWQNLFIALEAIDDEDVALLAITPDVRKRQVKIYAEARNLEAMLDYHRRLEGTRQLREVALIDHEVLDKVAEHPVRFNIIANWVVDHARP